MPLAVQDSVSKIACLLLFGLLLCVLHVYSQNLGQFPAFIREYVFDQIFVVLL